MTHNGKRLLAFIIVSLFILFLFCSLQVAFCNSNLNFLVEGVVADGQVERFRSVENGLQLAFVITVNA